MKTRSIHYIGYRVLGDFPSRYFPLANTIKRNLSMAGLRISHVVYISSMTFWTIVATLLAAAVAFPITLTLNSALSLNLSVLRLLSITLVAAIGIGALVLTIFLYYPRYLSGNIKRGIDKNLVYIINYMAILAGAGVTTEDIFTSLVETGDAYNVEDSAKSVVRDIEILGKDITSAIGDESQNTPSKKYASVLQGLIGIIRTGGDLREYLKESAAHQMEIRKRELSTFVSQLNLAAEAYIILGIAFPVILTTLLSMMGIFGGEIIAGMGPVQIMTLMTYLFFPLASIGVIILIDGMTSSW